MRIALVNAGLLAIAYGGEGGLTMTFYEDQDYTIQVKTWSDEDQITRLEPQVKRGLYGKLNCDDFWEHGYSPAKSDPMWTNGFEDVTSKVDVKMTLELSDSETAPTWWDKMEFVYMPHLNIWMMMDYCKTADSDEVMEGEDCPWSVKFEQYVWYDCASAFKGVVRKPHEHPVNPLEFDKEYHMQITLTLSDNDTGAILFESGPHVKPYKLFFDEEGQFAFYSLLSATTLVAAVLLGF